MRFSSWEPLATAVAPRGAGVLQVRAGLGSDGLRRYPRGTSAMVYYDGGTDLGAALDRARAHTQHVTTPMSVRFASSLTAADDLAKLLGEFERRFGALPSLTTDDG